MGAIEISARQAPSLSYSLSFSLSLDHVHAMCPITFKIADSPTQVRDGPQYWMSKTSIIFILERGGHIHVQSWGIVIGCIYGFQAFSEGLDWPWAKATGRGTKKPLGSRIQH